MSKLTEHQEDKLKDLLKYVNLREPVTLLQGNAGTGKTFLLNELVKLLAPKIPEGYKILCSAPTHKALKVLQDKVSARAIFNTAHSTLQYKPVTDKNTGVKSFKSQPNPDYPPLRKVAYWIIDEASMIPLEMQIEIEMYAKDQNTKVIFVGDDKQINPVGEEDSPVFWGKPVFFDNQQEAFSFTMQNQSINRGYIYTPVIDNQYVGFAPYPTVELTEIVRQGAGNPIIDLSRNLDRLWSREQNLNESDGYLYTQNYAKIIEELAEANGTDAIKYLAWSNTEVDQVNSDVRRRIYGEHPAKIELGETIVFDAPYKAIYNTNEEVKVESLELRKRVFKIPLEDRKYEEDTFNVYEINSDIMVLHDDSLAKYKRYVFLMGQNCKKKTLNYVTRNNFMDSFAVFKYNHALTVHKSQGSTYHTAIVNVGNINFNKDSKEKKRLFYTAITRASNLLILYNV